MKTTPARISFAAAAAFPCFVLAAHAVHPQLDPSVDPISEYALGPHGWLMTLAFFSWALSALSLAADLRRERTGRAVKAGIVLLVIGACGPLLAGLFPMDAEHPESTRGTLHSVGAVLGDALTVGAITLSVGLKRHRAAAALLCVAFIASTAAVILDVQTGWALRLYVLASAGWIGLAARGRVQAERRGAAAAPSLSSVAS